jgi:hypothetical protein
VVQNEGMPVHGRPFVKGNLYVKFEVGVTDGFVVQLLHMSQTVGFSLSRLARAARTPFSPYCSLMYETALVQSCSLYTHKHNHQTSIANLY